MRESAGSWIIKVLMGIMVAAFVLVGTGSYKAYRSSKVASVNGENITVDDYQQAYSSMLENIRRQFGNQLNDEILKKMNIQQQAMDRLIEATLLRQTAEKYGIKVARKDLIDSIVKIPAFQDNGQFDTQRYKMLLNQNRMTPASFETMQEEVMLLDKIRAIVTSCVKVSDDEAKQWYAWENASVAIEYVGFSPDTYKDIEISDAMIQEYYDAHKESYKTEPARKARYVKFDPAFYRDKINISEDEIQQYYTDHVDEFYVEETASGRQIVLRVPEKAPAEEAEKRKQEALSIIEKANAGEDFVELVKKYSEGPDKDKGGAMGPFTRMGTFQGVADAAFSMEIGGISDPIRTRNGWHIFKLEAKNPAATLPLEQVSDKIRNKLTAEKQENMAYDNALALYNNSLSGEDLVKNATNQKLNLATTDFFTESKGPDGISAPVEFAKIAFSLPAMEISDVSKVGDAYYLIQVIEEQHEQIPELDAVKENVRADVFKEQQGKAAENAAKQFIERIKEKGSIITAAQDAGMEVKTSTLANRNSPPPPELGNDASLVDAAFNLTDENKITENPVKGEKEFYVMALKERKEPPEDGYASKKTAIIQRLTNQKQTELFKSWIADLRKNSKIEISDKILKEPGL